MRELEFGMFSPVKTEFVTKKRNNVLEQLQKSEDTKESYLSTKSGVNLLYRSCVKQFYGRPDDRRTDNRRASHDTVYTDTVKQR